MTYWTWKGSDGDEPTLHVFEYGLMNMWEDGLTTDKHWMDADPPNIKPEVLADIKAWGGIWNNDCLQVIFPNGNDEGAIMWKLKYGGSPSSTMFEDSTQTDENGIRIYRGKVLK